MRKDISCTVHYYPVFLSGSVKGNSAIFVSPRILYAAANGVCEQGQLIEIIAEKEYKPGKLAERHYCIRQGTVKLVELREGAGLLPSLRELRVQGGNQVGAIDIITTLKLPLPNWLGGIF